MSDKILPLPKPERFSWKTPERGVYAASMCIVEEWRRSYFSAPFGERLEAA